MGQGGWQGGSGDPLLAVPVVALDLVRTALAAAGGPCVGLSAGLEEVRASLVAVSELEGVVAAVRLALVRAAEAREPVGAPGRRLFTDGGATTAWMVQHLRMSSGQARADLAAARATDPDPDPLAPVLVTGQGRRGALSQMGAALAEGAVCREQVDVAVRALRHLPTGLVSERGEDIDALLTGHARAFSPATCKDLVKHLVATVDPQGVESFADAAHERRHLEVGVDACGMVRVQGALDPVGGAVVKTVLDHLSAPDRPLPAPEGELAATEEGQAGGGRTPPEVRTINQRRADALVEACRLAVVAMGLENPSVESARVVIHCTAEQLAHLDAARRSRTAFGLPLPGGSVGVDGDGDGCLAPGAATCEGVGPISALALGVHACDGVLERVVLDRSGAVVRLESLGRLASRAQRRALAARDGGCAFPGCTAPPSWCDAHHVLWWSRGGQTVLDNLCLLCPRHHTEVHREHWAVTMREGVPWFVPPRWLDPDQVPRRNPVHRAVEEVRRAGHRLLTGQPLNGPPLVDPPRADPPSTDLPSGAPRDSGGDPPAPPGVDDAAA